MSWANRTEVSRFSSKETINEFLSAVYHALRQASMKGYLVLVVYPRSVRALTKRSEKSLSSMNLHNGGLNTTLSSSVGDLSSAAAIRSRRDWNFEESPFRQLPDPLKDPTDPLPRENSSLLSLFPSIDVRSINSFRDMRFVQGFVERWLWRQTDRERRLRHADCLGNHSEQSRSTKVKCLFLTFAHRWDDLPPRSLQWFGGGRSHRLHRSAECSSAEIVQGQN